MRVVAIIIVLVGITRSDHAPVQKTENLVGTWRLVSASTSTDSGERLDTPFGTRPTGLLIYTREGTMSALVSYGGRSPLSADRVAASVEERAEAFATFFAYGGRYSIEGETVIHHVEVASVQNWVKTDLVRLVVRDGDRITLRTPPLPVGGVPRTSELVWERVK